MSHRSRVECPGCGVCIETTVYDPQTATGTPIVITRTGETQSAGDSPQDVWARMDMMGVIFAKPSNPLPPSPRPDKSLLKEG